MKPWYESKIIWTSLVTITIAVTTTLSNEPWVQNYPQLVAGLSAITGVLNIIWRAFFTDTGINTSYK